MAPQPRCSLAGARAGKLVQRGQRRGASKPLCSGPNVLATPLCSSWSGCHTGWRARGLPSEGEPHSPAGPHLCVSSAAYGGPLHTLSGVLPLPFNRP